MSAKQHILNSLAATAKQLGRTPSLKEFLARVEFSTHHLFRYFPKWNEAVRAAGLRPKRSLFAARDAELLQDWGKAVRGAGALLSRRAYLLAGEYHPRTLERRFGGWHGVPAAFRHFAKGKPEWRDVLTLLTGVARKSVVTTSHGGPPAALVQRHTPRALPRSRAVYGDPLDFPTFRHEPVNEQGVVLLFGMLAKQLGFIIETVQTGFPDCQAKRQVAPGRWQRVTIEFEFESRNYRDHGHSHTGCDLIVCWRHNWPDCPQHLEVLELAGFVESSKS